MSNERRFSFRVPVEVEAVCQLIEPAGTPGATFPARTIDISAGGVKIATEFPVKVTPRLAVQLRCFEPYLDVLVVARRLRADDSARSTWALRFEALSDEARTELTKFVFAQAKLNAESELEFDFDDEPEVRMPVGSYHAEPAPAAAAAAPPAETPAPVPRSDRKVRFYTR